MVRQDYIKIDEWTAPQTVIRFISLGAAPMNVLLVDDFLIKGQFLDEEPPAPTTTTTTTTTTTSTTTTSTTIPIAATTTTTTISPTTTTTKPPKEPKPKTTKPPKPTTELPSSTTTAPPSTTTTTTPAAGGVVLPPPGSDESFRTKDALVVSDVARSEVPGVRTAAGGSDPVSLVVSFRTTAEAFTGGALASTILGVLIAVLAVIGLGRGMKPDTQ